MKKVVIINLVVHGSSLCDICPAVDRQSFGWNGDGDDVVNV